MSATGIERTLSGRVDAVAGAHAADPGVAVDVRYLTTAPDYEGFIDPILSSTATRRAVADGADVVYLPAGVAHSGGLRAIVELAEVTEHQLWAIGADEDAFHDRRWQTTPRARGHVLASTIKRFDLATRRAVEDYLGPGLEPGSRVSDLANGELALAMTGGHLDDVAPRLEELLRAVVAGEIVVPCVPAGMSPAAAAAAAFGVKRPKG